MTRLLAIMNFWDREGTMGHVVHSIVFDDNRQDLGILNLVWC